MKISKCTARGFTLVELLVVIAIIGILIGMLLPAVQQVREAARRTQCANNQRQLALAIHNYESAHGELPYGGIGVIEGTWMVEIMPFIEQRALADQFDASVPYWYPVNSQVVRGGIPSYQCPSDKRREIEDRFGPSLQGIKKNSYVVNMGNTGFGLGGFVNGRYMMPPASPQADDPYTSGFITYRGAPFTIEGNYDNPVRYGLETLLDGTSNTFICSEVIQGKDAGTRTDLRGHTYWGLGAGFYSVLLPNSNLPDRMQFESYFINEAPNPPAALFDANHPMMMGARSKHPVGVNVTFCDGSTHFVSDTVDLVIWRAMSTSAGSEVDSLD